MNCSYSHLEETERYMIMCAHEAGQSVRCIARHLCRAPSTISRELKRNKEPWGYDALKAHYKARDRWHIARTPRKLTVHRMLRYYVRRKLDLCWSPQQIAGRIKADFPKDKEMRISHETIYAYIYAMPKGRLRQEIIANLRRKRPYRQKQGRGSTGQGRISDMVSIHDRPENIEGRRTPGHWEGDLIIGKNHGSAVGTLVERKSRYLLLTHLENKTAEETRLSFTRKLSAIPPEIRQTLTYDQGKEMSQHKILSADLQMDIYFCDPHSPWQRGTNENTNGLIRQFLPKGTDMSDVSQEELDRIAHLINTRPRKILDFQTPREVYMKDLKQYHQQLRCCT